ncbi:MAG: nuclear transport factor 2 family protein [Ginsengibacter sp.]
MKQIALIFLLFIAITGCNTQKSKTMTNTENEKLILQYFEYFNNHDWAKMAGMYIETVEFKDPSLGLGIVQQTRQQIITKYAELHQMFPDLNDKVLQIYPSGNNHVIVEFISSGTSPEGSKFELPICTIFTIENGMITKDFTYYDNFEEEKMEKK